MAGKIIGYISSAILIFFGVLSIWGASSSNNPDGFLTWIIVGIITVAIGFGIIFLISRNKQTSAGEQKDVVYNIDLPGEVSLDTIKCESCGGALTKSDIKMVAGAPVVTCPFCGTTYQITEEPKW